MTSTERNSAQFENSGGLDPESPSSPDDTVSVSKSERKRQARRLQKLGACLVALKPGQLASVPLEPELSEAIALWHRITSHEARRRQLHLIGKLLRRMDPAPIEAALDRLTGQSAQARYEHHTLERWRERLIDDDAALTDYLSDHPGADAQALRHAVRRVRQSQSDAQRKTAARALFRLLRSIDHDRSDR